MKINAKPVIKRFYLQSDPDGKAWVEIRQPTVGDRQRVEELIATVRRVIRDDGVTFEQRFNNTEADQLRMYLCLAGMGGFESPREATNESGETVTIYEPFEPFQFVERNGIRRINMNEDEFFQIMADMTFPAPVLSEIAGYVDEMSLNFLPAKPS